MNPVNFQINRFHNKKIATTTTTATNAKLIFSITILCIPAIKICLWIWAPKRSPRSAATNEFVT